jgi:hypothetical protein
MIYNLYKNKKYNLIFNYVYKNYNNILSKLGKITKEEYNKNINSSMDKLSDNMLIYIIIKKSIINTSDFTLNGKKEMNINEHKLYHIITTNNEYNIIKFSCFLLIYYFETTIKNNLFMGLDFEFNNREIALCQLCFETNDINNFIFMIQPNYFDHRTTKFFINNILCNTNITRILHGSDSLDIPYIYNDLLNNNKNNIINFTKTLIDTRFICEYIKIKNNESSNCSIYDALHYFGTINKNKKEYLENIHKNMGEPEDISWNIDNLSEYYIKYALYDVIFLKQFYHDIIQKSNNKFISQILIPEITRFNYLEKRNITNVLKTLKQHIDPINNYIIKKINKKTNYIKNLLLINIYNSFIKIYKDELTDIMIINYFKKSIDIIYKFILYSYLTNSFKIYKKKNELSNKNFNTNILSNNLTLLNFNNINNIIKNININLINNIITKYT